MTSIIHPIHTVSQKFRPKHQVLVLKCYPKYQKTIQEVKPNSSELSYLLYYASTQRSKLQKVGAYLEKKAASDVWRGKLGNIQVTLQILTALLEKCPRDLALYSDYVLTIIDTVLKSQDLNMVEETIPTFETFCKYLVPSTLAASQENTKQYLTIVESYTSYASRTPSPALKKLPSPPIAIRWRTAGLKAIRAVVGSEALETNVSTQLNTVMPVILDNLHSDSDDILISLQQRVNSLEKADTESAKKRRISIATVTTIDTVEANPDTAAGSTADADKLAEEEVRVLAVRCLRQIFAAGTGANRGYLRLATALTLKFIVSRNPTAMTIAQMNSRSGKRGNWATSLVEAIANWTPVQDRFIIVVTAMESLVRSPIVESLLEKQLTLAIVIDWLLASSINLIGLSVMDVLLGLIQHTLLLLQLGGRDSKILPHRQQSDGLDLFRDVQDPMEHSTTAFYDARRGKNRSANETSPSAVRQELLLRLQKCIGDLATHIYYTDQITDMMTAILARLKPSVNSDVSTTAAAIDDPAAAARAIAESVSLREDRTTDGFFSFTTARATALRSIKDILVTANLRKSTTGAAAEARSRVGVQVWEGTQWLLRDEGDEVRIAYVDAFGTWLNLETNKSDLLLPRDVLRKPRPRKKDKDESKLAKRAPSNSSRKEAQVAKSTFVQLLHLAIYDQVLEQPENDKEILLLYLLLTTLIERLGVNAVRSGLPMILRLQEFALNTDEMPTEKAKVNVASLVHGYLWALTEKFDFETTRCGTEIHAEISRRRRFGVWLEQIKLPALNIDNIARLPVQPPSTFPEAAVESIRPYLDQAELVEAIAASYDETLLTPPTSPIPSPGRLFSVPTLGFGYGYGLSPPKPSHKDSMPQKVKDEMLSKWTREGCIAFTEKERTKSASMTASGTNASMRKRDHLPSSEFKVRRANHPNAGKERTKLPNKEPGSAPSPAYGLFGGLGTLQKTRRTSTNGGSPLSLTASSSREFTVHVSELKRALSRNTGLARQPSPLLRPISSPADDGRAHSSGSESVVSYTEADGLDTSTLNVNEPTKAGIDSAFDAHQSYLAEEGVEQRSFYPQRPQTQESRTQKPTLIHDLVTSPPIQAESQSPELESSDLRLGRDVPPVPRIPIHYDLPGTFPGDASPVRIDTAPPPSAPQNASPPLTTSPVSQQKRRPRTGAGDELREGRSTRRGNVMRPKSSATAKSGGKQGGGFFATATAVKIDLEKLLDEIQPTSTTMGGLEEEQEDKGYLEGPLGRPPY